MWCFKFSSQVQKVRKVDFRFKSKIPLRFQEFGSRLRLKEGLASGGNFVLRFQILGGCFQLSGFHFRFCCLVSGDSFVFVSQVLGLTKFRFQVSGSDDQSGLKIKILVGEWLLPSVQVPF